VNLKFLGLVGNSIQRVENLRCLNQLEYLDLADNAIEDLEEGARTHDF
jgi:hypothetical protein